MVEESTPLLLYGVAASGMRQGTLIGLSGITGLTNTKTMAYAFPWTTLTIPGIACMKRIQALVVLSLLFIANAQAQQGTLFCPQLPTTSKLHWDQNVGIGFLFCKASNEEGRMVLGVILTTRDPNIPMTRNHRAEKKPNWL